MQLLRWAPTAQQKSALRCCKLCEVYTNKYALGIAVIKTVHIEGWFFKALPCISTLHLTGAELP